MNNHTISLLWLDVKLRNVFKWTLGGLSYCRNAPESTKKKQSCMDREIDWLAAKLLQSGLTLKPYKL